MTKSIKNWDARKTNRVADWILKKVPHSAIVKEFGISHSQVRAVDNIINSKINSNNKSVCDLWTPDVRVDFITDAGNGMSHTDLANKYHISTTTVREYKAKYKVYVKSRGRVYAPSENRVTSKPKTDSSSQRKKRICNGSECNNKFMSENFGHRNCGCNAHKSISPQMLYA